MKGRTTCLLQATPARIYERIAIMCCASLFYDFLTIMDLDDNADDEDDENKEIMVNAYAAIKNKGIGYDPATLINQLAKLPDDALIKKLGNQAQDFRPQILLDTRKAYGVARTNYGKLDAKLRTPENELASGDGSRKWLIPDAYALEWRRLSDELDAAADRRDVLFAKAALALEGIEVDAGSTIADTCDASENDRYRSALRSGQLPIVPVGQRRTVLKPDDHFRALALMMSSVPFPSTMGIDEFSDFRKSKSVKNSLGKFRALFKDLVHNQAPAAYIQEEFLDRYNDYKKETAKLKSRVVFGNIKFVVTNIGGAIEDILKLRIENFVKRPFEVAEHFIDKKYVNTSHLDSPFYFLIEKVPAED